MAFFAYINYLTAQAGYIIGSDIFLLTIVTLAFCIKLYLLAIILSKKTNSYKTQISLLLLVSLLISIMFADSSWIFKISRRLFFPFIHVKYLIFWARINIGIAVIQYHLLALFLESLINQETFFNLRQKILLPITTIFTSYFFIMAFAAFNYYNRTAFEFTIIKSAIIYQIYILLLLSVIVTLVNLKKVKVPRILKKQMIVFVWALLIPTLIAELIHFIPFNILHNILNNQHTLISISAILTTIALFYCIRKVMGMKFLNTSDRQTSENRFNFIKDFKNILEHFSQVTSKRELEHITQNFFTSAFHIPKQKLHLTIRKIVSNHLDENYNLLDPNRSIVETFINTHKNDPGLAACFKKSKILITDDIEFSNFYEKNKYHKKIITFLHNLNAGIFIPIYEKDSLIAYITIDKYARLSGTTKTSEFYSNEEKDQMIVFTSYLGNIIKLLNTRDLKTIIKEEKELKEELYNKHQEINQYKESIRSFLKNNKEKKIGIIFYRNRQFVIGNQIAKKFIPININTHDGHPITKSLKQIANQVLRYKTTQSCIFNSGKNKLVIYGIPNIEKNEVIIAVHYPEISDILKRNIDHLQDPTKWDYLLYLETTESGKLINSLIPGDGETLLNFKIDLLKTSLSKKAILLDVPEKDLMPTVEILHHISLREKLYVINLQKPTANFDLAIKLFGINPIFAKDDPIHPILEQLNHSGTLFIKNVHFINLETQHLIANFIRYGVYRQFKGDNTTSSNVRIICSSNINLKSLVQEGLFSKTLFNELNKTTISMPPLTSLPEQELYSLTTGFTEQTIKTKEFKHIFELTEMEKRKIFNSRPASLQELKTQIQRHLEKKSKEHNMYKETTFYTSQTPCDPEIIEAARLGKKALRDPDTMAMLWKRFKNQNKIAILLGVNRSSVNRRCKDYHLQ